MTPLERLQARAARLNGERAKTTAAVEAGTVQLLRLAARLDRDRRTLRSLDRRIAYVVEAVRRLTRQERRAQRTPAAPPQAEPVMTGGEEDLYVDEPGRESEEGPATACDPDGTTTGRVPFDF